MKTTILNGKRMRYNKSAHDYLKRKLHFPDYYGNNLDALWDLLTTISEPIEIILLNSETLYENLGDYGRELVKVFEDAMDENANIIFREI